MSVSCPFLFLGHYSGAVFLVYSGTLEYNKTSFLHKFYFEIDCYKNYTSRRNKTKEENDESKEETVNEKSVPGKTW